MSESNFLEVPVSNETIKHFNDYIKLTETNPTKALEWAINRLTSLYWPDEGYPKKGVIIFSKEDKRPCWVLGETIDKNTNIMFYRISQGTLVETIRSDQIEILDD